MNKWGIFLWISVWFFACTEKSNHTQLPYYDKPDFTPLWLDGDTAKQKQIHRISSFSFTDQNGKKFTEKNLEGHVSLVNFFFTQCGSICPKMTHNLLSIQDSLIPFSNVQIVCFSVKPWEDSVSVLKNYEKENGLRPDLWHLVNGPKKILYPLARKSFFAEQEAGFNAGTNEFLHTEHIVLIDPQLHIRGIYNGTSALDMQLILQDLRVLEKK